MDFNLDPEQQQLKDSVRRYVEDRHSFEQRRKRLDGGLERDDWQGLADLGLAAIAIDEAGGGLGFGPEEMILAAEELGRGLVLDPFVGSAVLAPKLLEAFPDSDWKRALQGAIVAGEARVALAADEPRARHDAAAITARAEPAADGGWRLSGEKVLCLGGAGATHLIVAARAGETLGLFVCAADAEGVQRRAYELSDDTLAADFVLEGAPVQSGQGVIGSAAAEALDLAYDYAAVAACADAVGCMDRAIELTAEYMKVRRQFGKALAEFQVLQHGVAEMFIAAETARSILYRAVASLRGPPAERRRAVSGCKVKVMETGKWLTGQAIHQHGGIGMTMEYAVGHYLRRVMVLEKLLGDTEQHLQRYIDSTPCRSRRGAD